MQSSWKFDRRAVSKRWRRPPVPEWLGVELVMLCGTDDVPGKPGYLAPRKMKPSPCHLSVLGISRCPRGRDPCRGARSKAPGSPGGLSDKLAPGRFSTGQGWHRLAAGDNCSGPQRTAGTLQLPARCPRGVLPLPQQILISTCKMFKAPRSYKSSGNSSESTS